MLTSRSLEQRSRWLTSATIVVAILLECSFAANRSTAQSLYYRTIPIGERAIGLGGAFTGVANDPSAAYYNPAGIMQGGRFQLLGSFSSLVFSRKTIENAFDSPNADADFTAKRTSTIPRFIGTVVKFGRKRFGDHQFALAYSTLEVDRNSFGVGLSQIEPASSFDVRLNNDYNSRWYGVSFAAQATKKTALGFTAFVAQQRGNYSEDIGLASGGTLDDTGVRLGGDSVTSNTSLSINAWDIVLRLGALHRINPRWQVGFMFQAPGIPVSQKGNVFRRFTTAVSGGDSTYFLFDRGDFSTRAPIPWELRTGFEYQANALTMLSVDAAVTGPVRGRSVFDPPAELQDLDRNLGVYFANSTERRWTPNLAVGAEHIFGKVAVAGGLFTNVSAAPDVPATATEYTPDQVNIWGAAFSVGLDTKGYRLTVGANGYFGRGDALAATLDRETAVVSYAQTTSTISAVVLYIAGAVSVASKGAKQVDDKYQERRERKKSEKAGEPEEVDGDAKEVDEPSEPSEGTKDPSDPSELDENTEATEAADATAGEPETATEAPPEESPAEPH